MKDNRRIRAEARSILKTGWFGRLATVISMLGAIYLCACIALALGFQSCGIRTFGDFQLEQVEAQRKGVALPDPSLEELLNMLGASSFGTAMTALFGVILAFGVIQASLRAVRNEGEGLFEASFGGFRRPLDLLWFVAVLNVRVILWLLLLVIPGIVAFYRYRLAWYLKVESPDRSAGACLEESGELMRGYKMQAFWLDLSFLFWLFTFWLALTVNLRVAQICATLSAGLGCLATAALVVGFSYAALYLISYYVTSRAVFYRAIRENRACARA